MTRELDDQLTKYLTDAHGIEVQALAQLRTAPELAGAPVLAEAFRAHLDETEQHEPVTTEGRRDGHRRQGLSALRTPATGHARQALRARAFVRGARARVVRVAHPRRRA